MTNAPAKRDGYSLVEVVMATLIVGGLLVGSLRLVGSSLTTQLVAADQLTGPQLADALLAEIMAQPYVDPESGSSIGIDGGEQAKNRKSFDDVDDYHNWSASPPKKCDNKQLKGYNGWTRQVSITWAEGSTGNQWSLYDTGLKRITITVTDPDGNTTQRRGYRHKWGVLESTPSESATVVTLLSMELEIGEAKGTAGTNVLNHVVDPNTP